MPWETPAAGATLPGHHGPRPRGHEKLKPAARSARSTGPGHAGTRHRQHLTRRPGHHGPRPRGHEGTAFIERSQVMRGRAFRSGGLHSDCRRTVRAMRDDSLRLARPRGVGVAGSLDNSLRRRRVRSPGQQGTRGAPRCRRPAGRERQPGTAGPALFGLLGPCCNSPSGVVPQRGQMVDSREGFGPRGRALALTPARVVVRQGPAPRGRALALTPARVVVRQGPRSCVGRKRWFQVGLLRVFGVFESPGSRLRPGSGRPEFPWTDLEPEGTVGAPGAEGAGSGPKSPPDAATHWRSPQGAGRGAPDGARHLARPGARVEWQGHADEYRRRHTMSGRPRGAGRNVNVPSQRERTFLPSFWG